MSATEGFILFMLLGLILAAVEAFLPGGVAGSAAVVCFLVSAGLAFPSFGFTGGLAACVLLLGASVGFIVFWFRVLPRTRLGKALVLDSAMEVPRAEPALASLLGREGEALTRLAPGGLARIDGRRLDVLSDGTWVEPGQRIRVIRVNGSAITVRKVPTA